MAQLSDLTAFAAWYGIGLDLAIKIRRQRREPHWTESIAVGSKPFVRRIAALSSNRKRLEIREWADDAWYVRDPAATFGRSSDANADANV